VRKIQEKRENNFILNHLSCQMGVYKKNLISGGKQPLFLILVRLKFAIICKALSSMFLLADMPILFNLQKPNLMGKAIGLFRTGSVGLNWGRFELLSISNRKLIKSNPVYNMFA